MLVEKYDWVIQKSLFADTNQDSTFSYTHENSKMFNITLKYFSFFNNKPPASWVTHIKRDFLTCYFCLYYSSMVEQIKDKKVCHFLDQRSAISYARTQKQLPPHLLSCTVWKKKFLVKCKSEQFYLFFLLLVLSLLFFFFNILKVNFFTIFLCAHTSRGTLMEIRIVLNILQVILAIFDLEVYFPLAILLVYLIALLCSI